MCVNTIARARWPILFSGFAIGLLFMLFVANGDALAAADGRDIHCTPNEPGSATAGTCSETIDVVGELPPPPPEPLTPPSVPHANTGNIGNAAGGTNGVDGGASSDTYWDNCGTERAYIPCGVVDAPEPEPCGQPSGGTPSGPVDECDGGSTSQPPPTPTCQTSECCEDKAEMVGRACTVIAMVGCALATGPAAVACAVGGYVACEAGEELVEDSCESRLPLNKQPER